MFKFTNFSQSKEVTVRATPSLIITGGCQIDNDFFILTWQIYCTGSRNIVQQSLLLFQ